MARNRESLEASTVFQTSRRPPLNETARRGVKWRAAKRSAIMCAANGTHAGCVRDAVRTRVAIEASLSLGFRSNIRKLDRQGRLGRSVPQLAGDYKLVITPACRRSTGSCMVRRHLVALHEPGGRHNGMSQYSRNERNAMPHLGRITPDLDYPGHPCGDRLAAALESMAFAAAAKPMRASPTGGDSCAGKPSTLWRMIPSYRPA